MRPLTAALLCLTLGGLAGAGIALIVWRVADLRLRAGLATGGQQLAQAVAAGQAAGYGQTAAGIAQVNAAVQTAIQTQVIPVVQNTVKARLTASGITPQLIAQATQVLALARSAGVIR